LKRTRDEKNKTHRETAELIISQFLSPRHRWSDAIPTEQRFKTLTRKQFDDDMVAVAIRRMSWKSFFKTPYWEAVHDEALRRISQRCTVCAGKGPLRVHYRTEELHGFEHTDKGMHELLFLCKHCELTSPLRKKFDQN